MDETVLQAMPRSGPVKQTRKEGFLPGVLAKPNEPSTMVQFEPLAIDKLVAHHGSHATLWIELEKEKKFGFITELQRHPVSRNIIHIDIKLVDANEEIKISLPINFQGREEIERKVLQLQVYRSEVEVQGKATELPDMITAEVTEKELGDNVTVEDFEVPEGIEILDDAEEIYAAVKPVREMVLEEETEDTESDEMLEGEEAQEETEDAASEAEAEE